MKILNTIFKRDSDEMKIPHSAQGILPVQTIWQDGIFLVGKNKYSKSFKFMDINYAVASKEDKETMFLEYSDLLNSLDTGATAKITINNRRINKVDFKKQILLDMKNDKLDKYRKEYNKMLEEQAQEANGIVQEKIITISVYKKSEEDYFKMGNRFGRVLFLKEYASFIKDSMVTELTELNKNMMLSIDIIPIPMDEAVKEAENRRLGIETNITNWQRKQVANNNFSAIIPYDMEQQRNESKEFLDDLTTRDQRMFLAIITMVITSDSKEELNNTTDEINQIASKGLCQMGILRFQQYDGLNLVLPIVSNFHRIRALRTLTTESLAAFIPFKVQEIRHENGIFYGQNVISKNMIIADRKQLLNGNSFILGVSGSGKSFTAKEEIAGLKLKDPKADIIIIDPEREYSKLVGAFDGEVIKISATSKNHINAMDMNKDYGDGANPVILKSEFILSLCEQLIGAGNLGAKQKSIIDRCTANTYRFFQQGNYQGTPPTLQDFREELLKQEEPEAKEIALAIELFTNGSLNTFAMNTNVDTSNSLICYDILDLGKQLLPIGMLVVLDSILNRITSNRVKGKSTYIFIDEIYLLFQYEYSANFLFTLWKRGVRRIMFKDKDILISLTILLVTILVASSYYVISNLMKEKKENDIFKDLGQEIITDNVSNNVENNIPDEANNTQNNSNEIDQNPSPKSKATNYSIADLKSLKIKNSDLVGWIKVDGTNINYPVMQNEQFYLHRNFYKKYSQLGTPFLQEDCSIKTSDNLIVYGHHIKSCKMFADLVKYQNYNFYKKHKYIKFYTLENGETKENTYEICYVFKTTANENGFKFYSYTKFYDEEEFNSFFENCRKRELYNIGIETKYGDKFVTLVTCEYSQKNGRMVVIARKI